MMRGLCLGVLVLVACSGKDPYSPGEKLGTFHVTAKLAQTTCGQTPDPWEFDVKLNHEGSTLFWVQGGAPIQGSIDTAAKTELKSESVTEVRPTDALRAGCSIARTDVLSMTLANAEAKPTTDPKTMTGFAGTLVYRFTPTASSDCSDQTVPLGGTFPSLPCDVRYEVMGAAKETQP